MSLAAYQRMRTIAETPRSTEHRLASEITREMIAARDSGLSGAALIGPLHRNREMWAAFSSDCSCAGNSLPMDLRATIVSLALWVERFTSDVVAGHEPVDDLIEVNRAILDGLSAAPNTEAAA